MIHHNERSLLPQIRHALRTLIECQQLLAHTLDARVAMTTVIYGVGHRLDVATAADDTHVLFLGGSLRDFIAWMGRASPLTLPL